MKILSISLKTNYIKLFIKKKKVSSFAECNYNFAARRSSTLSTSLLTEADYH